MPPARWFVYVLQSEQDGSLYVGMASDLRQRLATHNSGGSRATAFHRPWKLITATVFPEISRARAFEQYLKSGSGRAFVRRHFVGRS